MANAVKTVLNTLLSIYYIYIYNIPFIYMYIYIYVFVYINSGYFGRTIFRERST